MDKLHFVLLLIGIGAFLCLKNRFFGWSYLLFSMFIALSLSSKRCQIFSQEPEGRVEIVSTKIDVRDKWSGEYTHQQMKNVMHEIDRAVSLGKKAVIFPESVLPFFLNRDESLLNDLKERAKSIDIILGSLYYDYEKNQNRNSIYFFHKGEFKIADKTVLVPFGESNPLPDWAGRWINRIFFDGAPDYTSATSRQT